MRRVGVIISMLLVLALVAPSGLVQSEDGRPALDGSLSQTTLEWMVLSIMDGNQFQAHLVFFHPDGTIRGQAVAQLPAGPYLRLAGTGPYSLSCVEGLPQLTFRGTAYQVGHGGRSMGNFIVTVTPDAAVDSFFDVFAEITIDEVTRVLQFRAEGSLRLSSDPCKPTG
jgi:hypothetical protein